VENFTENDLMAELLAADPPLTERKPNGVTVNEYAAARHISPGIASDKLYRLWQAGKLIREWCIVDGQRMLVYYKNMEINSPD
jgi:hypothetical protein